MDTDRNRKRDYPAKFADEVLALLERGLCVSGLLLPRSYLALDARGSGRHLLPRMCGSERSGLARLDVEPIVHPSLPLFFTGSTGLPPRFK